MDNKKSLEDVLQGVLFLFSETGTEGGYWAFQDSSFIFPSTTHYCKKCGLYWDKKLEPSVPKATGQGNCFKDGHEFKLFSDEKWSYDGLHVLEDGDNLTIYSPNDENSIVWSGIIELKQYPLFTEHASGLWIHADQIDVDRKTWAEYFFKNYPASLKPVKKSKK